MTAKLEEGGLGAVAVQAQNPSGNAALVVSPALSEYSRFGQRIRRRYEAERALLDAGVPSRAACESLFGKLTDNGADLGSALRIVRQVVLERLMTLDCDGQASVQQVTLAMTELAEFALDTACNHVLGQLDAQHGAPMGADGQRAQIWIVGMGKLGARELNVSSDIDLIYVYDQDGETAGTGQGRGRISNQEYFGKAVRAVYAIVGDTTEHGFVFRVDLALRPNGNSGPPAISLGALEEYFHVQGREWERFAWLKSRVVAPTRCVGEGSAGNLRPTVLPFVFRRYLDYNVFDSLRVLHRQIREHAARRSSGRPERTNDVKLSRGGIREIEFIVQLLQVVRGGQFPELRTRATLDALPRLMRAGLMSQETVDALSAAYLFLRQLEHRIQYLDDMQTHVLPTRDDDLHWIAHAMGHASAGAFLAELDRHREFVAHEFDALLGGGKPDCKSCNGSSSALTTPTGFEDFLETLPKGLRERVAGWRDNPRFMALRDESRVRLFRLISRTVTWIAETTITEEAGVRLADWIEPLLRRESYLALLLERPAVHQRLLRLLGNAKWPARYLLLHPGVIDELANHAMLAERFQPAEFENELEQRRNALHITEEDDDETLLNLLRRAHHAEVFRTLARDVEGVLTVEQVADDLSALALSILRVTSRWCWSRLRNRHRDAAQLAVIAYGKLGGMELGYGSDLDIVFVYEDDDENAAEIYATFVRKLINWLTVKTGEGDLYEIDTALRPNGNSGLLVTSFEAFAAYQEKRGSNTAWTWEHQAMTRARFVLGDDTMRARFDAIRRGVVTAPRDADKLREEIVAMREKVRAAHPVREGRFDVKHSPGGMVDVEFVVQYLVLSQAAHHEELVTNAGNIALLQRAQAAGLLPDGIGTAAAQAYRALRKVQHHARLNEETTQVPAGELDTHRDAVLALWHAAFGSPRP
ncbi:MAG: bifunctional [glutamate--ammonia ligase]-adenylyl-L-tyrosine phosphorylase/[glutamate--ammonia-ligase] adenylyltransferase [Burkholderiaceae bacterium]|nr:bifunctional [glutamate--ammonia ligase]-adenylyl-L-tyrosine phosphorylase/[glutamate--ammonia-ligase] adenylyltransferase [Rhodoferax sp.]